MSKTVICELFCGSFGWSAGFLDEGFRAIGFDIEHLPHHGPVPKGADLVLQDVKTLHGSQLKDAAAILCGPPCTKFAFMSFPFSAGKKLAAEYRSGVRDVKELTALFDACFRIQREAIAAAGRYIPLIVENVRGAIPWVGAARARYGSFFLWGDVGMANGAIVLPGASFGALRMEPPQRSLKWANAQGGGWFGVDPNGTAHTQTGPHGSHPSIHPSIRPSMRTSAMERPRDSAAQRRDESARSQLVESRIARPGLYATGSTAQHSTDRNVMVLPEPQRSEGRKSDFHDEHAVRGRFGPGSGGTGVIYVPIHEAIHEGNKGAGAGAGWYDANHCMYSSRSAARKAASARIARIPYALSRHIARCIKETL